MTLAISAAHNDARLEGTRSFADMGASNSRIYLYATTQPATGADPAGSPVAIITLAKPCGAVVDNLLVLAQNDLTGDLILATNTVLWARWISGTDALVADGTVSDSTGTGDIKLAGASGTLVYSGGRVLLGACTIG
ncbi:MAG: hypothetical protein A2496_17115 [Burkholderiales bacterium RIFOXYC12_FULL_60_6]|nr:MAG: hypothetical protein A2503_10235 [Burkholderiales bacterium RIFOXYD12_FULL_59_19]OGB76237.1 MAG: hypothetical protein A2496_17115 [Burkholderiales bacterium RIFOXYC12_FULL_60_6]